MKSKENRCSLRLRETQREGHEAHEGIRDAQRLGRRGCQQLGVEETLACAARW